MSRSFSPHFLELQREEGGERQIIQEYIRIYKEEAVERENVISVCSQQFPLQHLS